MTIGSLVLFIVVLIQGQGAVFTNLEPMQWGWTALTALLLLGYVTTWYTALKHAPATYVATLLVPATLVTNVLSAIFITHTYTGKQAISTALFIAGILLMVFFAKKTADSTASKPQLHSKPSS